MQGLSKNSSKMLPPTCVIVLNVGLSCLAAAVFVVAVATDHFEHIQYTEASIRSSFTELHNSSILNDTHGYYKVVYPTVSNGMSGNSTTTVNPLTTMMLFSRHGGIWRLCTETSDAVLREIGSTESECFNYITDYTDAKREEMEDEGLSKGIFLIRIQNSAASCTIVSLLLIGTSIAIGGSGIINRQIAASMVTGVMYIIAAVFTIFEVAIMHTKIGFEYRSEECYAMENIPTQACLSRTVTASWSLALAWLSIALLMVASLTWFFLARVIRLEKTSAM